MDLIESFKRFSKWFRSLVVPHHPIDYALYIFVVYLILYHFILPKFEWSSPIGYGLYIFIACRILYYFVLQKRKLDEGKKAEMSIYKGHFDEVDKRRKEELKRLTHYVPIKLVQKEGNKREEAKSILLRCLNNERNAIIVGDSGAGKTFTFLKLFEELKKEFSDGKSPSIPLFIELYKFNPVEHVDLPAFIQKYIRIDINRFHKDKKNYILFLDGLNESPDPNAAFREIMAVFEDMHIFISTQREEPFFPRDAIYYMLTLGEEEVIRYLSHCSRLGNETSARTFYNTLNRVIQDQTKRPIFLFFLASLYQETGEIPTDLDALLSRFVNFVCKRTFESGGIRIGEPLDPFYEEDVLPYIAYSMCKENKRGLSEPELRRWFLEVQNDLPRYYDFRTQVCKRYWLIRQSVEGESFEFTHELLRNYFATKCIRRNLRQ